MFYTIHKNYIIKAILLIMGYGLLHPMQLNALQRDIRSIDSIAYIIMNRGRFLFGTQNHVFAKPEIQLRSSQLSDKACRVLGSNEAFYVYNDANGNNGFVIVSADERMPEVLAYSHDAPFDTNDIPPSVRYWLECYLDEYMRLDAVLSDEKVAYLQSPSVHPGGVEPILGELPWGQGEPYNSLCPFSSGGLCVVGCVATAMSQVMWHHKWPACGRGDIKYLTRTHQIQVKMNLAEHPLQWNLIKERYNKGNYTDEESNAVATLMAACGAAVHMDYAPDGSGAYQEDILRALVNHFSYDPDAAFLPREYFTSVDWHSLLIAELNEGRAVNYAGQSRTDGGHSFVIDGYQAESSISNPYYHLNWGWYGRCNGYYTLPQLHPVEDGKYYIEEGFSIGQQMLIGVRPDDGQSEANKMLCAEGIKVMQATLKPGDVTTIKVNAITNLCYRTFRGKVAIQLEDENGNLSVIGKTQIDTIPYLESQNNLIIPFGIPESFEEGSYSVRVVGINEEGKQTVMYSRTVPQITVSYNPYGEEEPEGITLLCSSEFEVFKQSDVDSLLNLRVYEIYNYSNYLLEGDLQLEIASDDGTSILNIGSSVWHPAIEPQMVDPTPIILTGSVPDTLSNGQYRLYIVFYPIDRTMANRVKFFDYAEPSKVPVDYFLPMRITDDVIDICGVTFERIKTNIKPLSTDSTSKDVFYSISGALSNKGKGLKIIKKSNGKVFKLLFK